FGDHDEAREPGLRGEQIVVPGIQTALRDPVTDGEEVAYRVKKKAEVHGPEQSLCASGKPLEALDEKSGRRARHLEITTVTLHRRLQGEGPPDHFFGRLRRRRAHAFLGDEAAREIGHRAGMRFELSDALRPVAHAGPRLDGGRYGIE